MAKRSRIYWCDQGNPLLIWVTLAVCLVGCGDAGPRTESSDDGEGQNPLVAQDSGEEAREPAVSKAYVMRFTKSGGGECVGRSPITHLHGQSYYEGSYRDGIVMTTERTDEGLRLNWVAELGPVEVDLLEDGSFSFESDTLDISGRLSRMEVSGELSGSYKKLLADSLCSVTYTFAGTRLED